MVILCERAAQVRGVNGSGKKEETIMSYREVVLPKDTFMRGRRPEFGDVRGGVRGSG